MSGHGTSGNTVTRMALGCVGYLLLYAVVAMAVDRWTAPRVVADARPWLGWLAAVFFTLALASAWGVLRGYGRGRDSRAAILARAAAGTLPDGDGLILASGTVRPSGASLHAPLSGTACVAYTYRMYYEARDHRNRRIEVPVYWGQACRPFLIDTPTNAVRIMAVPHLADKVVRRESPEHIARARAYVGATRFDEASGLLGAVGSAITTGTAMFTDDDGESRFDWKRTGEPRDPSTLLLEESVLPIGATASVAGPWSIDRHAIMPASDAPGGLGVTVTTGPVDTLLGANSQIPASTTTSVVLILVLTAIGVGIVWGGMTIMAPPF